MFSVVSVLHIKINRICNLFSSHLINEYIRGPDNTSSTHPTHTTLFGWKLLLTRMHSSRMRTTRLFPVSPSMHCSWGGVCSQGVSALGRGVCFWVVSAPRGGGVCSCVCSGGIGIPACTEADPPCEQNHRHV